MTEERPLADAWERREVESVQSWDAFRIYRDMGAERSYAAVARQLRKSLTLINRWGRVNEWALRVRAWDAHLDVLRRREREQESLAELESFRKRQRDLAAAATNAAIGLLSKAGERLRELKASEIEPRMLPLFFRAAAAVANASSNSEAQALAVAELMQELGAEG